jgi:hypothetical protein
LVNRLFGDTPLKRWPIARQIYENVGSNCQFVLYQGAGHEITTSMKTDIMNFFRDKI